jgi:tRNA(fMet)-specific endonuclease VapC
VVVNRILLDTSAYSALMRGDARVLETLREADEVCVTPIILGELRAGFLAGSRRKANEGTLREFLDSPRVRVIPLDEGTSERYAVILCALRRAGTPIPTNDLWISASAMQHGLKVLTTDAHFQKVQQIVLA